MWRRTSLLHLNLVLYATLAVLVAAFGVELRWAAQALPKLLVGRFEPLAEEQLSKRAREILASGGDPAEARALLERSLAIDPNSVAVFLQGEAYRLEGDADRALEWYRRYLAIDPHFVSAYVRIASIHAERGEEVARRDILERGIERLRRRSREWRPVPDASVASAYSEKARSVHAYYREGLRTLRSLR